MTDQERRDYIAALTRELNGYLAAGMLEHAAEVSAELDRLAAESKLPHQRATRRVVKRGTPR